MTSLKLRDRDAIFTREGLIFRVYGYSHPPGAFVCDPEYAPASVYKSENPRALRTFGKRDYCKFFSDEGLRFVQKEFPQYMVWHEPLQKSLVGVKRAQILHAGRPAKVLRSMLAKQPADTLLEALHEVLDLLQQKSSLTTRDFGVFGSLLHGFYHPRLSDIDLVIYGIEKLNCLRETLDTLYRETQSPLRNEFTSLKSVEGKRWKFLKYSLKEYVWHQKRKLIYALLHHKKSGRTIKAEFEPVKQWKEIRNGYSPDTRITPKGWTKLLARVTNDSEAPFMPSIYQIEPVKIFEGKHVDHIQRVVSFVEEFRMQAQRDELVVVEGNLEQVAMPNEPFHLVTLSYGPRYYEQTLKIHRTNSLELS